MSQAVKIGINQENYKKSYGLYRYGRKFTFVDLEKEGDRNSLAWFLTYGLVNEALLDGFDIIDTKTKEPVNWNDDFQKILKPLLPDIVFALGNTRLFGHSLIAILNDDFNKTYVRSFDPENYGIISDKFGNITFAEATEEVIGLPAPDTIQEYEWETPEKLENIYHSVNRITKKRNQGKSYLNPIWDELQSLASLNEQTTIFVIRNAAGQIIISAPSSVLSNAESRATIINAAKDTNAANGLILLPQGDPQDGEGKTEWTIQTATQGFDPVNQRQLWIQSVSAYSGVPALRLEGAARNYSTAKENTASYIEVLQDLQGEYLDELLWLVKRIASRALKKTDFENIEFKFAVREQLTEKERTEELKLKFETLSKILKDAHILNITLETAKNLLGLEYEETEVEEPKPELTDPNADPNTDPKEDITKEPVISETT